MQQYIDLMKKILDEGHLLPDRTGDNRKKIFGHQMRFNLQDGFPLVTTRQISYKTIVKELIWFISGSSNNKDLTDNNVNIWTNWSVTETDIDKFLERYEPAHAKDLKPAFVEHTLYSVGPMYGEAWRHAPNRFYNPFFPKVTEEDVEKKRLALIKEHYNDEKPTKPDGSDVSFIEYLQVKYYEEIDQLNDLIIGLKRRPYSSRHIINAWIPEFIPFENISAAENVIIGKGALAHCHVLQQYLVLPPKHDGGKKRLSLMMTQRSTDVPLGLVFNIAQYAMLLSMIAQVVDMEPFEFIWSGGDNHIYGTQIEKANIQIQREPLPLPKLVLNPDIKDLFDFKASDIEIINYQCHEKIDYPISI